MRGIFELIEDLFCITLDFAWFLMKCVVVLFAIMIALCIVFKLVEYVEWFIKEIECIMR